MQRLKHIFLVGTLSVLLIPAKAQPNQELTRILFLLDASYSMAHNWERRPRMTTAKEILTEIVDSLRDVPNLQMGLRVYGHMYHYNDNNCNDTRLEVSFREGNENLIKSKLKSVQPRGITPIALSLEKCERDFSSDKNSRNIVILITDGEESCEGDPCAVSRALQTKGIILKPFVIGLGEIEGAQTQLGCVGSYYEAEKPGDLQFILRTILRNVLDRTTTQVNLLDIDKEPTETDVPMTFFNPFARIAQYRYYHTINDFGYPDTLDVDPLNTYDLVVHTIPPVQVEAVKIKPNQHNIIEANTPMGSLLIQMQAGDNSMNQARIQCLVRQKDSANTLHVQSMNSTERYLVGTYDLDILTLPRIRLDDVKVDERQVTRVEVPNPGLVSLSSTTEVLGAIFVTNDGRPEKVYQLNDRILKETVALQPGTYELVYRYKSNRDMRATNVKKFTVNPSESLAIKL